MSKTSFGKLAIGVVALSSSVLVHAEGVRDAFRGWQGGANFSLGSKTALKPLTDVLFAHELGSASAHVATHPLFSIGGLRLHVSGSIGGMWGGPNLYTSSAEKLAEQVPTEKLSEQMGSSTSSNSLRTSSDINGVMGSAGLKGHYSINYRWEVVSGVEGGMLVPSSNHKKGVLLVSPKVGMRYNTGLFSAIEVTGKYNYFLDSSIKNPFSLNVAYNHTF